ncbi:MAG: UDP-N-acetylglucosamine 1-carboxyvinyltransferase [Elusimicrobia bacterium RIFOXYA2_FULL_39_19]|nr:MAG: UDP-N-acetylglucosamine 1-carboxyvinyltransferase [Elusimicrobia bacterium RIFOXYA2_FULL_39_19]
MDKIIIEGAYKLSGEVNVSGSKNAALPILIATLLTDEKCVLDNVPELKDIETTTALLEYFGKIITKNGNKIEITHNRQVKTPLEAPYELVKKMRASFIVAGPLLARYGRIKVALPGGCAIGVRPVDIHLKGFEKLGAKVTFKSGYMNITCSKLKGTKIKLRFPSVGATENLMITSALAKGKTIIENAAREPEIVDLADFLNALGARVIDAGKAKIEIHGVEKLHGTPYYSIIPDRIEAGTYLVAGAITKGCVTVNKCLSSHLKALLVNFRKAGLEVAENKDSITVKYIGKIKPVSIKTQPYPGFPTDLQAQWMALMCNADGKSEIAEKVFENRFIHVSELQRLGADLTVNADVVTVTGESRLTGAQVMVSDLRAGAALVLAGLAAEGKTTISHIYHLDRGYEHLENKLRTLGAKIFREIG